MRRAVIVLMVLALASGEAEAVRGIVERPVAFSVVNQNRTGSGCEPDGLTYTLRGTLHAPRGALSAGADAVALYLHGSGDGSSWHFEAFPARDHVARMAELGHVSVTFHSLGYGTSDMLPGTSVCAGSYVDMHSQVIGKLRSGDYTLGARSGPAFERVALVGHSGGGLLAEAETIMFGDADALVIAGWADVGIKPFFFDAAVSFGTRCAQGGEAKRVDGPGGWAHVFTTDAHWAEIAPVTEPEIAQAFRAAYEQEACGLGGDLGAVLGMNAALASTITMPTLLTYGDRDVFFDGAAEVQRARLTGVEDLSLSILPHTDHMMMLGPTAPSFRLMLSEWLRARGF